MLTGRHSLQRTHTQARLALNSKHTQIAICRSVSTMMSWGKDARLSLRDIFKVSVFFSQLLTSDWKAGSESYTCMNSHSQIRQAHGGYVCKVCRRTTGYEHMPTAEFIQCASPDPPVLLSKMTCWLNNLTSRCRGRSAGHKRQQDREKSLCILSMWHTAKSICCQS